MRSALILTALLVVSGCTQPVPTSDADGSFTTLSDGWNCHQGRCLRYFEALRQVQIISHEPAGVPSYVKMENNQVSARDFLRLYYEAQGADWL